MIYLVIVVTVLYLILVVPPLIMTMYFAYKVIDEEGVQLKGVPLAILAIVFSLAISLVPILNLEYLNEVFGYRFKILDYQIIKPKDK